MGCGWRRWERREMQETINHIEAGRIVAILRGDFRGREEEIVAAMRAGGLTAVEVTLNSPDALAAIGRLANRFGSTMAVGAGTVLSPENVRQAIMQANPAGVDVSSGVEVSPGIKDAAKMGKFIQEARS